MKKILRSLLGQSLNPLERLCAGVSYCDVGDAHRRDRRWISQEGGHCGDSHDDLCASLCLRYRQVHFPLCLVDEGTTVLAGGDVVEPSPSLVE